MSHESHIGPTCGAGTAQEKKADEGEGGRLGLLDSVK